ncbi:MAG: hypothetical protein QOI60_1561, partial [Actinomycetota bacterium]|nr:hypothetical protein [Actinomycetota bacterium]
MGRLTSMSLRRWVLRSDTVLLPVLLVSISVPSVVSAATTILYVDRTNTSCSNSGPATQAVPLCTIGAGATRARAGTTVEVLNGTYNERVVPSASGTPGVPIVFDAADRSVTVTGAANGFYLSSRHDITISNFTIAGTTGAGIYLSSCSRIVVSRNTVTTSGQPSSGSTAQGISVHSTTASTFIGNTAARNSDSGIYLVSSSTGNVIQGNTTYANARGYTRAAAGIDVRSSGNTVIGNLSYQNEDS